MTFVALQDEMIDTMLRQIGGPGLLVLVAILRHRNRKTGEAFPATERIATITGLKLRRVQYAIQRLEQLGILKTERRRRHATRFVLVDAPWCVNPPEQTHVGASIDQQTHVGASQNAPTCVNPPEQTHVGAYRTREDKEPEKKNQTRTDALTGFRLSDLITTWNALSHVIQVKQATPKREAAFQARLTEPYFREHWREALAKFPLRCCLGPGAKWKPDVDFFLKPDSVLHIIEGKYDWLHKNGDAKDVPANPGFYADGKLPRARQYKASAASSG